MTDIKELIQFLDERMNIGGIPMRIVIFKDDEVDLLTQIKSFLEQQYQHEQNILNYGTDEPEEKQPQPDNELISVCCRAKIKIEYVDCGEGQGYPREICAKCRKEIIEVPIQPDEVTCNHDAIEWNPYNQVVQCHRCGEHWKPQPQPDEETIEAINCKAGEENMEGEIRSGGRPKLDRMDLEQRAIAIGVFIPDDISDLRLESLVNFAEADQIFNEKMRKKP